MLSGPWYPGLDRLPKTFLLTIAFTRDIDPERHPALMPRALRFATRQALVTSRETGETLPFWPCIAEWPNVTRQCAPEERRAPVATQQIQLTKDARFPHTVVLPVTAPTVFARLDLWQEGVDLEDALPRLAGPVIDGSYDRETGGVQLTISDGDTDRKIEFPPGQLTFDRGSFPDAPDIVLGRAKRLIIFGPFPDPIPCTQIDQDGRIFYLSEPFGESPPYKFQVSGIEVPRDNRPTVAMGHLADDPTRTFTQLVFPQPIRQSGLLGFVTAGGGVGFATASPALTLLRDIGGYRISRRARMELERIGRFFNFSVMLNNTSDVMSIVNNRILPQTDVMMTQHLNQIDCMRLLGETGRPNLGYGQGLWNRVQESQNLTRSEDVNNVIEVLYKRTSLPIDFSTISRDAYTVDENYGGPVGGYMARSQANYGRRFLSLEAADLVQVDQGVPPSAVLLAELTALLTGASHRRRTYDALWSTGLRFELYDGARLTDPVYNYDQERVRVVRIEDKATGPRLTFQTEDLP